MSTTEPDSCIEKPVPLEVSLVSGAIAGIGVDVTLFPLDTVKTRLQSAAGFLKSGGFRGVYAGIASAAAGSGPSAATFFVVYELTKNILKPQFKSRYAEPVVHIFGATFGEVASLVVRLPFEVVKQRAQAYSNMSSIQALRYTVHQEGPRGLYRGFWNTVWREVPYAWIQYPLWEFMKSAWAWRQGELVGAWQSGLCGALSGAVAAAATTPFDVAKTRVMLAKKGSPTTQLGVVGVLLMIRAQEGISGLFAGCSVRVVWIAVGGGVFFGLYEKSKIVLLDHPNFHES